MIRTIAEIGLNHNGNLATAKRLQQAAADAGCWAVKYQIRTDFKECSPPHLWDTVRQWQGRELSYFDYRAALELDDRQLRELYDHAQSLGLQWFASCWDVASVARLANISRDYVKVASAHVTNGAILNAIGRAGFGHAFLSTGMSTEAEIDSAAWWLRRSCSELTVMYAVSTYPCSDAIVNLDRFRSLKFFHAHSLGYSGHERDLLPSLMAATLGATYIERHVTLDKNAEGSDHKVSLEPHELRELCEQLKRVTAILGKGGRIEPLPEERAAMEKLRGVQPAEVA
jgi:N-acetylneuraminate synthase